MLLGGNAIKSDFIVFPNNTHFLQPMDKLFGPMKAICAGLEEAHMQINLARLLTKQQWPGLAKRCCI